MNWLLACWNWFFESEAAYSSVIAIAFTINTWTASLESIRNKHARKVQRKVSQTVNSLRDPSWLNILNSLPDEQQSSFNQEFAEVISYLHEADSLKGRLETLEFCFRWAMIGCAISAIVLLLVKYHPFASVVLLLPYPIFVIACSWNCYACNKNIQKRVEPLLNHQKAVLSRESRQTELANMQKGLNAFSEKLGEPMETVTF